MKHFYFICLLAMLPCWLSLRGENRSNGREKYNFNPQWLLHIGDTEGAQAPSYDDRTWKKITLPRAFNEDESFKVNIKDMTDTIVWYRKHFKLPRSAQGKKVFIEFEGVRQGADFYLNGKHIGLHENGVMACGLDLTPYIKYRGENVLAVRVDNSWRYKERSTRSGFQWNDRNFNANYGGIPKNAWLHLTNKVYQTLPLYSNLKTTGVYVYASDMRIQSRTITVHTESEVKNETPHTVKVDYEVEVYDYDGKRVASFRGEPSRVKAGQTTTVKASAPLTDVHFWSWGYGYLYDVHTRLLVDGEAVDEVCTRTGFRKTRFGEGKVWLNDRVIQMKGYAQRSSNEWPGVGMSVPPWMSDYSNRLMIEHNANFYRWMHVTPWKQDVESCDRTGVMQMVPAGDAERDVQGRRWELRKELMRDMIIYLRNNPSVIFYESGNESISREHMLEMKAIRDRYDPHGGRAIGSREMLDIRESEYGGEMLYINKSCHSPMIQTEYCRDEGLRKYWDSYSYPFHQEGDGPLHKGKNASAYNHNQDQFAIELVRRWYDMWRERPGTGRRINSGGAKIVFSDTQTYGRGAENYRRSGVVDPLRIPKDGFFAHRVMWDGWVDVEQPHTHIIGHWNYDEDVVKPVYVVSSGEKVELFVNGKSQGFGKQDYRFLFTFDSVRWEEGIIEAVSYDCRHKEISRHALHTVGEPSRLKLTLMQSPAGVFADGADIAMVQVEVTDKKGHRCPLANNLVRFELQGPAEWRGGIAQAPDNYVLAKELPVECGVTRVLLRSGTQEGEVTLKASAQGLPDEQISFHTQPVEVEDGLSTFFPARALPSLFERGETPSTPSYRDSKVDVRVVGVKAGSHQENAAKSFDDNELSEWANDGKPGTAWITYQLERRAEIDDICIRLTGFRQKSYPLEVYAGDSLVWKGDTPQNLGYAHLLIDHPVCAETITIRLQGSTRDADAFGQITEVEDNRKAGELDMVGKGKKHTLRIIEVEFLETLHR